jgi:hypothetical protein
MEDAQAVRLDPVLQAVTVNDHAEARGAHAFVPGNPDVYDRELGDDQTFRGRVGRVIRRIDV